MKIEKNQKINYITILDNEFKVLEDGKKYNLCKCDCGNEKYILNHTLRTQRIRDCGCGTYMLKKYIGQTINDFTVVNTYRKRIGKNQRTNIICVCKCKCGNTIEITASSLNKKNIVCDFCKNYNNLLKYKDKTYGCFTVIDVVDFNNKIVKCKCKCGSEFNKNIYKITSPTHPISHCVNCDKEYKKSHPNKPYIYKNSRLKHLFYGIVDRCYNSKCKDYKWYGGKGIKVYEEWLNDVNAFCEWSLNNGYSDNLTIDRIDGDKDYCPENCRWTDWKHQQNNRCNNVKYEFNGKLLTISEISDIVGINYSTLRSRLRSGIEPQKAFTTPLKRRR